MMNYVNLMMYEYECIKVEIIPYYIKIKYKKNNEITS